VEWVKEGEMSKLLRVPFGLNLDVKDADGFLVENYNRNFNFGVLSNFP